MKDPVLVLGWVWAIYLACRLAAEALRKFDLTRAVRPAVDGRTEPAAAPEHPHHRKAWTPMPAVIWLAAEAAVAFVVVGAAWLVVRDLSLNLVPTAISASPADVRHVALAAIVGWSLFVINVPFCVRLIGRLLPPETKKIEGGVDPERMGAAIGVLERILVIALMPGGPTAVGFVVAAKTLARFKELDKKRFAERYLLGTMTSVSIAVASAMAAGWVWALAR